MTERRDRPGLVAAVLLALAALVVGAAAAVEVAAEPAAGVAAEPVPVDPPGQGVLHCPVTAGEEESTALTVTPASDEATEVTVLRYGGGAPSRDEPVSVEPGAAHVVTLDGEAAREPVGVAWEGGPAVATWVVADAAGAPCEPVALPVWHIPGFDTTANNDATLHLFNPFAIDAVVRVTFGTPTGEIALVLTDNVLVPARSAITLDVNEYEPEQPELSVNVEVLTGRVVAQGELDMEPTEHQPGPAGRTLLAGVGAPATDWGFGAARDTDADASWLVLHNPEDRDAAVEVRVAQPADDSDILGREHMVPAGGTTRVDLAGASEAAEFGVLVVSRNGVPVVATRFMHADRPGGEDVAASIGTAPDTRWALAGARTAEREAVLTLSNLASETTTVAVDAGAGTPEHWGELEVVGNGRVRLDLEDVGNQAALPVRLRAEAPVVADLRVLRNDEPFAIWTAAPVAAATWDGPGARPPVRWDATLSTTPVLPALDADAVPAPEELRGARDEPVAGP
jgi:hypothetical protein